MSKIYSRLTLLLTLTVAPAAFSQSPLLPDPGAAPEIADSHRRLETLAGEVERGLERAGRNRGRVSGERLRGEAARLRAHLEQLERDLARLPSADSALLEHKLRNLEGLVSNLERAAEGSEPPRRGAGRDRRPSPQRGEARRTKATLHPNDHCGNATEISLGETVLGSTVGATNDGSASCGSSLFAPDVWYKYVASDYGYVSVDTFGSDFDTVVSVHWSCPGQLTNELTCNDDAGGLESATTFYTYPGEEYWIRVGGFHQSTGQVELHLGEGGEISGTVTSAATGDPVVGGRVEVRNADGYYVFSDETGSSGDYAVAYLDAGAYFVAAEGPGLIAELFDDVPCAGGRLAGCRPEDGTPVAVESVGSTAGIDLALATGGVVTGTVTENSTGNPISGASVLIFDADGNDVISTSTGVDGTYELAGLATGSYFVAVSSSAYADELYDDLPWIYYGDPTTGTAVQVVVPQTTSGIDFALDRLGAIEGLVTESSTGDPIAGAYVRILDGPSGYWVTSGSTGADGRYSIAGLSSGDYKVVVEASNYLSEAYDDLPCPGYYYDCDLQSATLVSVDLNLPATGIDFALDRLGTVTGTVTEAGTAYPVSGVYVGIWNSDGDFVNWSYTDSSGIYTAGYLPAGTYFAVTDVYGSQYVDELYDEAPCPSGAPAGCDPTTGTPILVAVNATTAGIDFTLDLGGSISGSVRAGATGDPVPFAYVRIWNDSGNLLFDRYADFDGGYSFGGLATGTYFVAALDYGYQTELYDGLDCPGGVPSGCDPTTGTPVAVALGAATSGVDFSLDRLGSIGGTVTDTAGNPLANVEIDVWDASGDHAGYGYSGGDGRYDVRYLPSGTYFVTTDSYYGDYLDELYDDTPCFGGGWPGCDPTTGTPVAVTLDTETSGIDFALGRLGSIHGTITDMEGNPLSGIEVDVWNANGSHAGYGYTGSDGGYEVSGLAAASYFVSTRNYYYGDYIDELHADIPCIGGGGYGCDPKKGDPVVVAFDASTRVDFDLRSFGSLSGRVTDVNTGLPLVGVTVDFWDPYGYWYESTTTGAAGAYSLDLQPGRYYVSTTNAFGLVDEVYDGVVCPDGPASSYQCDPIRGTPVDLNVASAVTGIDFALGDAFIFIDGFESGDVSQWSSSVGN